MNDDPYLVLGLGLAADDDAVRAAYHAHVRAGTADARINAAYASLRGAAERERLRFTALTTFIAAVPQPSAVAALLEPAQLVAVVQELAFISDWELGDA